MAKKNDIITQDKIFLWLALATVLILLIPFILTETHTGGWKWKGFDFLFGFVMIFGFSSMFVLTARKVRKNRLIVGVLFLLAFLYTWAEAAVGVFTTIGS